MFFEKNSQALLRGCESHRYLIGQLQALEAMAPFECHEATDGQFAIKVGDVFLHDPENPVREAQEAIRNQCETGPDRLHLVIGLGLGYLPDELFRASPGKLLIYEPNLPLLRFVLENVDLSELLGSGRVWLVAHEFDLLKRLRKQLYAQYRLDVLALKGYAFLLANDIPALMEKITALELDRVHDFKTGEAFHFKWLEQFFLNCPAFAEIDTADVLFDRFAGKPALVISRGPSLDQAIDAVRELSGSAVLIAAGSAVRRLWEAGVTPDFAVFYDANGMQEQLRGIPHTALEKITFLVSPFTQPCCYQTPSRGKLLFLGQNNGQFAEWLDKTLNRSHQRIEGGGTVSLIAFQMAMAMRCDPVILVGQDLAFPGSQAYAGAIPLQLNEQGAMALPASDTLYAEPETMDIVTGQDGELLPALKAYKSFIRHFEDLALQNARSPAPAKLYNASLGGARIDGFELKPLSGFCGQFSRWKFPFALPEIPALPEAEIQMREHALLAGLTELQAKAREAIALCGQLQQAVLQAQGQQAGESLIGAVNRQWNQCMQDNPFIAFMLLFELMGFRERIQALSDPKTLAAEGKTALLHMLSACSDILENRACVWIETARQGLSDRKSSITNPGATSVGTP